MARGGHGWGLSELLWHPSLLKNFRKSHGKQNKHTPSTAGYDELPVGDLAAKFEPKNINKLNYSHPCCFDRGDLAAFPDLESRRGPARIC